MSELLDKAYQMTQKALALGADEAKVSISRSRGVDLEWRDGQVERLQDQTEQGLSLSLFINERFSSHSTCDLRTEALESFLNNAIQMTRFLEADPCRSLPDPTLYQGRAEVDLDLYDAHYKQVSGEQRREEVEQLEELTRASSAHLGEKVISVSTCVSDGHTQSARVHSNGFEGETESSTFYATTTLHLKEDDGKRPVGGSYSYRRHREDLRGFNVLAQEATRKAEQQLGAQKLATGKYTVVVENRSVGRLLGAMLSPLGGAALQQKRSLWEGRLGQQIASPLLSIYDQPHLPRGLGSALWDGDGFACKERPIIDQGVLQTYLINDYYAKKMTVDQGQTVLPTGANLHNLVWQYGDKDLADLIKDIGDGVLINRFLGGNSNGTTGEFSLGCAGHVIRNGQLAEPITEVNMSGQLEELWSNLALVGSDAHPEGSSRCPSCVFENLQLSGT